MLIAICASEMDANQHEHDRQNHSPDETGYENTALPRFAENNITLAHVTS